MKKRGKEKARVGWIFLYGTHLTKASGFATLVRRIIVYPKDVIHSSLTTNSSVAMTAIHELGHLTDTFPSGLPYDRVNSSPKFMMTKTIMSIAAGE
jgi:hypothetical protein